MYQTINRLLCEPLASYQNIDYEACRFYDRFPDEHSCRDPLLEQRQHEGVVCRKCKGTKNYWMKSIEQFQCKECRTRTTLRSGTVMESSNLSFHEWFMAMHLMTATKKQSPVLVIAETEKVKDRQNKRPVFHCKFSSYVRLNKVVKKHIAKVVKPDQAGIELPWVHIAISNAKRNLLNNYHHIDDIFLQNYLDEFTFKLNRRYFGEKLFDRLLIAGVSFNWST